METLNKAVGEGNLTLVTCNGNTKNRKHLASVLHSVDSDQTSNATFKNKK